MGWISLPFKAGFFLGGSVMLGSPFARIRKFSGVNSLELEDPRHFQDHQSGDRGGFEVITIVAQKPCRLVNSSASAPSLTHDQSSGSDA